MTASMTGSSDAERKGHKRKLADALQSNTAAGLSPSSADFNAASIAAQVGSQIKFETRRPAVLGSSSEAALAIMIQG